MCPHLKLDGDRFYCGKSYYSDEAFFLKSLREGVCDMASRDLWCLDDERYHLCIYYIKGFCDQKCTLNDA